MMKMGKRCGRESWIFTETLLLVIARLFLSYIKDSIMMNMILKLLELNEKYH